MKKKDRPRGRSIPPKKLAQPERIEFGIPPGSGKRCAAHTFNDAARRGGVYTFRVGPDR